MPCVCLRALPDVGNAGKRLRCERTGRERRRNAESEQKKIHDARMCGNGVDAGGNESEKEKGVISTILPKIITHSPLRDLELPGCHFDTVRGIKDIPRARCSSFAINLGTDDYADLSSELPRRRNRSRSLDGGTDYREKWFVELKRCASLQGWTEGKWSVATVNKILSSDVGVLLSDREDLFERIIFFRFIHIYRYVSHTFHCNTSNSCKTMYK